MREEGNYDETSGEVLISLRSQHMDSDYEWSGTVHLISSHFTLQNNGFHSAFVSMGHLLCRKNNSVTSFTLCNIHNSNKK